MDQVDWDVDPNGNSATVTTTLVSGTPAYHHRKVYATLSTSDVVKLTDYQYYAVGVPVSNTFDFSGSLGSGVSVVAFSPYPNWSW